MRAQLGLGLAEKIRHLSQIAFHAIQVHQEGWRFYFVRVHPKAIFRDAA
jgi:hypothetical protein